MGEEHLPDANELGNWKQGRQETGISQGQQFVKVISQSQSCIKVWCTTRLFLNGIFHGRSCVSQGQTYLTVGRISRSFIKVKHVSRSGISHGHFSRSDIFQTQCVNWRLFLQAISIGQTHLMVRQFFSSCISEGHLSRSDMFQGKAYLWIRHFSGSEYLRARSTSRSGKAKG